MYLKRDHIATARLTLEKTLREDEKITLSLHENRQSPSWYKIEEKFNDKKAACHDLRFEEQTTPPRFFSAAKDLYSAKYYSLNKIKLLDFSIDNSRRHWYTIGPKSRKQSFKFQHATSLRESL